MAGELAAEWIKIPDGNGNLQKVWVRDSTARRDIAQLQTDVSGKADAATTLAGYGITDAYTKTQVDGMIPSVPSVYTSNPEMDGTASPGSSTAWARGDHVHPHDSTKADVSAIPTKTSDLTNDSGFITSAPVTSVNGQTGAVTISVPTKTSDLTNDSGYITSVPVQSVNGQTGAVSLDASDVGALPDTTAIPSKTSDLSNDSGFITASAVPHASTATPSMDGTGAAGASDDYARADHVHPHDATKQDAGKFAVIDGTLAASSTFSAYYTLPDGFTKDNSLPVSISVIISGSWRAGDGCAAASGSRLFAEIAASGVRVYNNASAFYNFAFKVIIMRTDI